jgi:hypothetical protein
MINSPIFLDAFSITFFSCKISRDITSIFSLVDSFWTTLTWLLFSLFLGETSLWDLGSVLKLGVVFDEWHMLLDPWFSLIGDTSRGGVPSKLHYLIGFFLLLMRWVACSHYWGLREEAAVMWLLENGGPRLPCCHVSHRELFVDLVFWQVLSLDYSHRALGLSMLEIWLRGTVFCWLY